jgi:hypothetical protein
MLKNRLIKYLLILLISSCAVKVPKQTEPKYEEDLSSFRTTYQYIDQPQDKNTEVDNNLDSLLLSDTSSTTLNIKSKLDLFLDTVSYNSRRIGYIQGFTIQVYTGNSRKVANEAKSSVYKMLPGSFPKLFYQQPNFKVKVGQFYTRYDAQKIFNHLKREFPRAIVIPERIVID